MYKYYSHGKFHNRIRSSPRCALRHKVWVVRIHRCMWLVLLIMYFRLNLGSRMEVSLVRSEEQNLFIVSLCESIGIHNFCLKLLCHWQCVIKVHFLFVGPLYPVKKSNINYGAIVIFCLHFPWFRFMFLGHCRIVFPPTWSFGARSFHDEVSNCSAEFGHFSFPSDPSYSTNSDASSFPIYYTTLGVQW
jgi:hypothetical protein